jgi:hypothetical protein
MLRPRRQPNWPNYSGADALLPMLSATLDPVIPYLVLGAGLLLAVGALARLRPLPNRPAAGETLVALALAFGPAGLVAGSSVLTWLAGTAGLAALLLMLGELVRRLGPGVITTLALVPVLLGQLVAAMQNAFPGARAGAILAMLLLGALALGWARAIRPSPFAGR